jgi:hypothetical protein
VRASEAANEIVPFLVLRLTESTLKAIGARARAVTVRGAPEEEALRCALIRRWGLGEVWNASPDLRAPAQADTRVRRGGAEGLDRRRGETKAPWLSAPTL